MSGPRWVAVSGLSGAALLWAGCASYSRDVRELCTVAERPEVVRAAGGDHQQLLMSEHLERTLRTAEARSLYSVLAHLDPESKVRVLSEEASKAGLDRCALADWIEARAQD